MNNSRANSAQSDQPKGGAKTKLFGVVLIFVGILDSMLAWRGGFSVRDFYVVLIISGIALYLVGVLKSKSKT